MARGERGAKVENNGVQAILVPRCRVNVRTAALSAEAIQGEGGGDEVGELAHVGFGSYCGEPL